MAKQQSQQQQEQPEDPFELTPEHLRSWYLKPFQMMDAHLRQIRKSLIEDKGVRSELAAQATSREKSSTETRYEQVLKLAINRKNNQFYSLKVLEEQGVISPEQADEIRGNPEYHGYNNGEPPFYYISRIERIYDQNYKQTKKSWLVANLLFEGLTERGQRINKSATIGYHAIPKPSSTNVMPDPKSTDVLVELPVYPPQQLDPFNELNRVYDIEYSRETLDAMLKHAYQECSLGFRKLGTGKHFTARNIDDILTEDPDALDALIKEFITPKPTNEYNFNLDPRQLADFLKYQKEKEQQGEAHYG